MLELKNLSKNYTLDKKTIHALKNLTLNIKQGDFISIVGPSGSGKSTLLNLIGGLDKPTSGLILFNNQNILTFNDSQLSAYRNFNIGFVFQQFHLEEHLTIFENTALPLYFSPDSNHNKINRLVNKALKDVDIFDRSNHRPSEVSGGQAQRAAIARALVNQPSIILADEPTGDLDPKNAAEILKLLKKLQKEKNITLIIVTHDETIANAADKIIKLKDGVMI
ncbi:ABC transporter ATP-binding protein [Patescibacteria group bacterium]|nr:ABC transporter ATP-binding protein [Patescibacteria group bacterium]